MFGSLLLLIPISLVFVVLIGVAFWWAIFSGQFDSSTSAGESILKDDDSAGEDGDNSDH
ncbi:MAG TPA: cbb3-type cytochrome oxidase assembly protein CcoS [Paenalcaligenes sp.]|nr:cbb3-type cytochrome oxidase assembly protein CcoS [Paenalcaligenes sp.]